MRDTENKMLSVIVPIYNASAYLPECIESILNQTYTNLEVILMDDGSTDGSAEICTSYQCDTRIHIFRQENQGVAAARKNAMENVHGSYVVFLDSDDYVERDFFEKLLREAEGFDLVTSGYFWDGKETEPQFDGLAPGSYRTLEQLDFVIDNMIVYGFKRERGLTPYIWNKLFRTELARQVFQEVDTKVFIGEDSEFLYRYVLKCNAVNITRLCGYHYCSRERSIVNRKHDKYLINLNELYLSLRDVFQRHPRSESLMRQLQMWTNMGIRNAPYVMGFQKESMLSSGYMFPFYEEMLGKRVLIYGAGSVGRSYYIQLQDSRDICTVGWTDKNVEKYRKQGYPLTDMEASMGLTYDFIIIAVYSEATARQIKEELHGRGIPDNKIVWRQPICVSNNV